MNRIITNWCLLLLKIGDNKKNKSDIMENSY